MAEKIATRYAYGDALCEFGEANDHVIALDADVSTCTMSAIFGGKCPKRFLNVGISEANMIGMGAGLATLGFVPVVHAFAMFCAGRGYDQIRNSVCYPDLNVKMVGTHAGLSVGEDGATHQCLEDIALMRVIPNMTVLCPADALETREATKAMLDHQGPVYLRLGRLATSAVSGFPGYRFELGKAVQLRDGSDVTVIATGMMVQEAVQAADELKAEGVSVRVLNMHTIKPIDREAILSAARETGAIVTAEEHSVLGGLGAAVCEVTSGACPVPVLRLGTMDTFGRSGDAEKLLKAFGLSASNIKTYVAKALEAKKK